MNCLLKHVIEENIGGRIKVIEVRGRRRKQLLDDLGRKRILETEKGDLDRSLWTARFRRGCGPVARQTPERGVLLLLLLLLLLLSIPPSYLQF